MDATLFPVEVDGAQESVEFLCAKFQALFAQLHREDTGRQAAERRSKELSAQLSHLRSDPDGELSPGNGSDLRALRASLDRRSGEAAELRRAHESSERRMALGSGEADALAETTWTYERQADRLRERFREEHAACEARETLAAKRGNDGARESLRLQRAELQAEFQNAEASRSHVAEELRLAQRDAKQTGQEIGVLEQQFYEEQRTYELSEETEWRQREELLGVERQHACATAELDDMRCTIDNVQHVSRRGEEQLHWHAEHRGHLESELRIYTAQLAERRREASDCRLSLGDRAREAEKLSEMLRTEKQLHSQEEEAAETTRKKHEHLSHTQIRPTQRAVADAQEEIARLHRAVSDLEQKCTAQCQWHKDMKVQHDVSGAALAKLQGELHTLLVERSRLQQDIHDVVRECTKIEVELEVVTPALADTQRRYLRLEERLAARARELADEVELGRRYRSEAATSQAKLHALERRTSDLTADIRRDTSPGVIRRDISPGGLRATSGEHRNPRRVSNGVVPDAVRQRGVSPIPPAGPDAVRFLCEFIRQEEDRLGLSCTGVNGSGAAMASSWRHNSGASPHFA